MKKKVLEFKILFRRPFNYNLTKKCARSWPLALVFIYGGRLKGDMNNKKDNNNNIKNNDNPNLCYSLPAMLLKPSLLI